MHVQGACLEACSCAHAMPRQARLRAACRLLLLLQALLQALLLALLQALLLVLLQSDLAIRPAARKTASHAHAG